jgi:hypothetical protein
MILTPLSRSCNAIRFIQANGNSVWAVLGQSSPWEDDSNPPAPSPTATTENSPFAAFQATAQWVYENGESGTYAFVDTNGNTHLYSVYATAADVIAGQGTIVMLTATASGANLSALEASFRQVGFATSLVPASGYESDTFLAAAHIESWGNLETLENRVPVSIISESSYAVAALLQF